MAKCAATILFQVESPKVDCVGRLSPATATASEITEMARRAAAKTTKAAYKQMLQVVGSVIHEWDPYCLIAGGAPEDEFDWEIALVVAQIPRIKTEKDAVLALSRVFSPAFDAEGFTPELCTEAGKKLFAALRANGFVS